MMKFEIGDEVRMKHDGGFTKDDPTRLKLVVQELCATSVLVTSNCKQHQGWVRFDEIELVHRPDRQANLEQAIRKVLLSKEFLTAFAAAFRSEAVSQYTFSDEVRSLEHPTPGVNRPMRSEAQLSQMVEMVRQSLTTETGNSPETLDSSNPSESLNSSFETPPKPSKTQPPTGYRLLGDAKDEPRCVGDIHWCVVANSWCSVTEELAPFANRDNWEAWRKIEKKADKSSVSRLVEGLSQAMQNDQDLAWTWHCNIAVGSLDEGVDHKTANLAAARFLSIAFGVDVTTFEEWKQFDWTACRKIETPIDEPTSWTPKVGDWVKITKPVDCAPKTKIWWIKAMDRFHGQVLQVTSVWAQNSSAKLDGQVTWEFDFAWLSPAEDPRGQPAPPKRYRDPTLEDLKNGPIECEYRDSSNEQWRSGFLVYILNGAIPFLCVNKEQKLNGQWAQCRIEVAE